MTEIITKTYSQKSICIVMVNIYNLENSEYHSNNFKNRQTIIYTFTYQLTYSWYQHRKNQTSLSYQSGPPAVCLFWWHGSKLFKLSMGLSRLVTKEITWKMSEHCKLLIKTALSNQRRLLTVCLLWWQREKLFKLTVGIGRLVMKEQAWKNVRT